MRRLPARVALLLTLAVCALGRAFGLSDFYWEAPAPFSEGAGRFPISASGDGISALAWQESTPLEGGGVSVRLSLAVKRAGQAWQVRRAVAGPYVYSRAEPAIASIAVDGRGRILIAAAASDATTEILISDDEGRSFSKSVVAGGSESAVAPRVFVRADGGYLLFVTRGAEQSLSIHLARSQDGRSWSPFEPFVTDTGLRLNFLPTHVAAFGRDYVVFQSLSTALRPTFQLYLKSSADGGRTWSPARLVTGFRDPVAQTRAEAEFFDNQRAYLALVNDSLFLAWERRAGIGSPQIYATALSPDGTVIGDVDRVTTAGAYCNNPIVFERDGRPTIVWFDNRRGRNRVYLAQKEGIEWQDVELSPPGSDAAFVRPAQDRDGLFVFWQAESRGADRIFLLEPDRSVPTPVLAAENFQPGARVRRDTARFSWRVGEDTSGIAGYAFSWSMNEDEEPPRRVMAYAINTTAERVATEDGPWYFSVIAQDYAGNWSSPARIEFLRDTTPPPTANILPPARDERGFLASNTFSIEWNPPPASDIAGYAWDLEYLAPLDRYAAMDDSAFKAAVAADFPAKRTTPRSLGPATSASFVNRDDGVWRFTVSAVDEVGNVGESTSYVFRANKYVPYTYVTFADAERDEQGVLSLRILGRGFAEGGAVSRVFLDRDGIEPYDREFSLENGDYRVLSDREIAGLRVEDMEEGTYRIGVLHPTRGLRMTAPLVAVDESGTVKFGDYAQVWEPSWRRFEPRRFVFDSAVLVLAAVMLLGALGLAVSVRGIGDVISESAAIRLEVAALITGDLMPSEKKAREVAVRKRGGGLRLKLASFTSVLVVVVVVIVSVPLSILMTRTQEQTLLRGLKDRSRVLMDSLASGARAYLPSRNVLELGFLPAQAAAVPEARYATITGFGADATIFSDHVWATNDPDIESKIDTADFQAGVSRLEDLLTPRLKTIAQELDDRARLEVGDISASIADLTQEGLKLALSTDRESVRRRDDIQSTTRTLEARLNERLTALAAEIGSEPEFPTERLTGDERVFVFFKPVMYRQGSEDLYFRGLVRLEVSVDSIVSEIAAGRAELFKTTLLVALAALAMGVAGALLLSSVIIRPIKRLVAHVETIRDTENKADLAGKDIAVKSKDEIAVLGDTINDMTHGLVKAALASQDLTIGKEVQKMFIPLETDRQGNKLTTGRTDTANAEFFGYYEGAKGVSGDYFDYLKLDDRYYAVIKCDVAGKGVPAALIMIEVATLFLNFFKNWKPTKEGMQIDRVVYQINDFIESRGFKGRFAAFTLCLFDSVTGEVHFCNAGDNIVHWYDASEGRMKLTKLAETPTAGVFANFMVEMKSGYPIQKLKLDVGDTLLLYTDGIEEAKRRFRDANYKEIECTEGGAAKDTPHGNHSVGQADEELGYERVEAILEAVMHGGRFSLAKYHDPNPEEKLDFDFSGCAGSVEDMIMALVAVEKVFRMYRDPAAGEDARVLVDRKVDAFLKERFDQYRIYCARTKENPLHPEYMYYTHIKEDEQYDDLTILGIRKK